MSSEINQTNITNSFEYEHLSHIIYHSIIVLTLITLITALFITEFCNNLDFKDISSIQIYEYNEKSKKKDSSTQTDFKIQDKKYTDKYIQTDQNTSPEKKENNKKITEKQNLKTINFGNDIVIYDTEYF